MEAANAWSLSSVSDSRGNSYVQAGTTIAGTGLQQAIYYAKNIAAGSNTVTVSFNQAAAYVDVRLLEYSGLDTTNPLDATAGAAGTSNSSDSGAATTTSANELIFGAGTTGGSFNAAGTGFTVCMTPARTATSGNISWLAARAATVRLQLRTILPPGSCRWLPFGPAGRFPAIRHRR